jgi:hypothetical protein
MNEIINMTSSSSGYSPSIGTGHGSNSNLIIGIVTIMNVIIASSSPTSRNYLGSAIGTGYAP